MTGAEIRRFNGALHLMRKQTRVAGKLWWLTTDKGASKATIAEIQKRVSRLQSDYNLWSYNVTVFESRGGLHAHILFIGNAAITDRLNRSAFGSAVLVEPVTDPDGLSKRYLAKERTPQAGYKRPDLGGRIGGSHRLPGGGDRVRLSRELERDAIEAGLVEPWIHTNAKRKDERQRSRLKNTGPYARAPRLSGQILLFPELSKPVSRLRAFGGGLVPPAVAEEIEFQRGQRGLTQRQLAALAGRSQSQLSNALRGHDPISALAVNRLRDALLA